MPEQSSGTGTILHMPFVPLSVINKVSSRSVTFSMQCHLFVTGPDSSVGSVQGTGGHGFDSGPQHTRVVKTGT